MFGRSWVRILAPNTDGHFVTYICCKNCKNVCLKRPKINDKRGRGWHLKKAQLSHRFFCCNLLSN